MSITLTEFSLGKRTVEQVESRVHFDDGSFLVLELKTEYDLAG